MATVEPVVDHSFDREGLQTPTPVLIDCWPPWCAPRRAHAQSQHGVRGIPDLFRKGQVKEQIVGAVPQAQLVGAIGTVA